MVVLLAGLSALGPFSIDTYLPAFPAMEAELATSRLAVQQTLAAYMATFAFMTLWHGALSDSLGRRRVILAGMAVYALASLVCAAAPAIEWLWLGRGLQGLSAGAGMVVARAVIRDLFEGPQAQRLMSRVMTLFAVAPAVAPMVGGAILPLFGWRAIFVFLAAYGLVLGVAVLRLLPETLPVERRHPLHPRALARGFHGVFTHGGFVLLALAMACIFNGFFIYVLGAPKFVLEHLHLSEQGFIWLFGPTVVGMMLGSTLSGRVAGRWSPRRAILTGFAVMLTAITANLAYHAGHPGAVPWSVLPIGLYNFGMALATPSLTLMALDLVPQRRGMAASCQSFLQVGLNSVTASLIVPLLWDTPLTLALGAGSFCALGLVAYALAHRRLQMGAPS
jgi:DHA1 family bicyclomycin/chloramphenicol resistance-like MFS transporter